MEKRFVAYFRVSTDRQGQSGLGLEAQQQAVSSFIAGRGELVASFTEVESGRKNDRPQLAAAIAAAKAHAARLVIAKLDRLARNVHFISGLMESGVEFVAVDMPEANRLTIHILAAVAEHEREAISQRTKAALAAAKARGQCLGSPSPRNGSLAALERRRALTAEFDARIIPVIEAIQREGITTYLGIASRLNELKVPTRRGGTWHHKTVRNVIRRARYDT